MLCIQLKLKLAGIAFDFQCGRSWLGSLVMNILQVIVVKFKISVIPQVKTSYVRIVKKALHHKPDGVVGAGVVVGTTGTK